MANTDVQIFCTKCKTKTDSKDLENVTLKNGRPATRGKCVVCDTRKFLIGHHKAPAAV